MEDSIKIYNSLGREKKSFKPINPPTVNMYVCGPTVYDEPHIGHARSAYIFDVIRRYFIYKGYKVKFVRNITDVDDKIIDKARNEFKDEDLNIAFKKIANKYIDAYHEALGSLGIATGEPDIIEPKASEYIDKMKVFINNLIERGMAYQAGGDVYFDITKAKEYGKLSNQSLEKMEAGARVEPLENKKNPLDFALWKSVKKDEPSWDSPWGKGRPGWHIECSVMSSDLLGDEFDIHGGGLDLIFPHHENEIVQSEGADKKFARVWMHHGLLTINGQKMAKSLGNFVTIKDFLDKYKNADFLKLFFLATHYSHPIDYTEEKMEEAKKAYERIFIMLNRVDKIFESFDIQQRKDIEKGSMENKKFEFYRSQFQEAMDDDFNMPQALAVLQGSVTKINTIIDYKQLTYQKINLQELYFIRYILIPDVGNIFELDFEASLKKSKSLDDNINILIEKRNNARKNKDFALADKIRKDLEEKGIILEDTKDGKTTWRKKL